MIRVVAMLLLCTFGAAAQDASWSRFRGPNGTGVAETTGLPVKFGPTENLAWKLPLPPGHSSPILSATSIFLTAFDSDKLFTYAIDRGTGKIRWKKEVTKARKVKRDRRNNAAAASAAVDKDTVVVFFADYGMLAYDHAGNEKWRVPLGPFNNLYGVGASPIIVDDLVYLPIDQNTNSYLLAVSKHDGKEAWKVERPFAKSGHCTPIVYRPKEGAAQLILPGSFYLDAYDLKSGERIWWVNGLSFEMKSTPVLLDDVIYINGYGSPLNQPGNQVRTDPFEKVLRENDKDKDGNISKSEMPPSRAQSWFSMFDLDGDKRLNPSEWQFLRDALASMNGLLAIKVGGKGDMTKENVLWSYRRSVPQLPSPLVYGDVCYILNDSGGLIVTLEPEGGKVKERGRLKDAMDRYYASPVAGDGKIYCAGRSGVVSVLPIGGSLEPLAVNQLEEDITATPALADGHIYLRTAKALYCFAESN